jgi:hypothetical protein
MILVAVAVILGAVVDLLAPPEHRDPNSWAGPLSILGTTLFVVPYLAMVAANGYLLVRLWRRPPPVLEGQLAPASTSTAVDQHRSPPYAATGFGDESGAL